MTRTKKEVLLTEAQLWYEDAVRAELKGDFAEKDRCMAQSETYKKEADGIN